MLKRCSKCGIQKDVKEYDKDKSSKDGFQCWCKGCRKKHYEEHKEQRKSYLKEHKERIQERQRIYKEEHKEALQKCDKKYREEHKKEKKSYGEEHKEERAVYSSKYRKTRKGKVANQRAQHKRHALTKNTKVDLTIEQWQFILKNQNNRCNRCGKRFTTKRPATQDHIIPVKHNGDYSSDNIQALCNSCNSSKCAKLVKEYIQIWNIPISEMERRGK